MGSDQSQKKELKNVKSKEKIIDKTENKIKNKKGKIKCEGHILNIKSKYILKQVFDNLWKGKTLSIIKLNKIIKDKLDITINDYKNFAKEYSSIIIEMIPAKNIYDKFININKKDEPYYHIYFNDEKEEIKRYYLIDKENVGKILVKINYKVISLSQLFEKCACISSINFKVFQRENITDISYMFKWCYSLRYLNISNFVTKNVTDMRCLFDGCILLNEIDLSHFSTSKVTDMGGMFYNCSSLKNINLSNFDTYNVNNLSWMFAGCYNLKNINLYNFYTPKVKYMNEMFFNCSILEEVNILNFVFKNDVCLDSIFKGCTSLKQENIKAKFLIDLKKLKK